MFSSDNRSVYLDGERLQALRRERALTREALVDASVGPHRLSLATLKRAEGGLPVYLETARRLAALLGVQVQAILPATHSMSPGAGDGASAGMELTPSAAQAGLAVAVLPFRAIGREPGTRTLAEGLVEDLTIRLGHYWFPVICCSSTRGFSPRDPSLQVRTQLLADYLVLGSVQRSGSEVRVRVRLVRSETAEQLWQNEYQREYSALFALQDELTNVIIEGVNGCMVSLASGRVRHRDPSDLEAWELTVLGSRFFQEGTREQNQRARDHLQQSVNRDAGISWAWYLLAQTYQQELIHQWTSSPREVLQRLQEVALEFERQHAGDARAALVGAYSLVYQGRRDAARDSVQQAISSGPNLSRAYCLYGQILAMGNEPDRALEQLEMAVRLSPRDGQLWAAQMAIALSHFVAERHDEALRWAESAAQLKPELPFTQATLASLSAWAGNTDSARQAFAHLARIHPAMSTTGFGVINASTDPEIAKRFLDGLRRAGLPA